MNADKTFVFVLIRVYLRFICVYLRSSAAKSVLLTAFSNRTMSLKEAKLPTETSFPSFSIPGRRAQGVSQDGVQGKGRRLSPSPPSTQ